jgi:hypothetical protein
MRFCCALPAWMQHILLCSHRFHLSEDVSTYNAYCCGALAAAVLCTTVSCAVAHPVAAPTIWPLSQRGRINSTALPCTAAAFASAHFIRCQGRGGGYMGLGSNWIVVCYGPLEQPTNGALECLCASGFTCVVLPAVLCRSRLCIARQCSQPAAMPGHTAPSSMFVTSSMTASHVIGTQVATSTARDTLAASVCSVNAV